MKFKNSFILILLLAGINSGVFSQNWDEVEVSAQHLSGNVYMMTGAGGNIGFVVSGGTVAVIDAQFSQLYDRIREVIGGVTSFPVKYLLNTHWHFDHTSGNAGFSRDGAIILAHENVRNRRSADQHIEFLDKAIPKSEPDGLPSVTFTRDIDLWVGEEYIIVKHIPNAHTDSDVLIYFESSNVIHMGDIYLSHMFPFVDLSSGGNINGYVLACKTALEWANEDTRIIPGHGTLSNTAELQQYYEMLKDLTFRVGKAKTEGKGLKEITEMGITDKYEDNFGGGFISAKDLLSFIYSSL